MARVKGLLWPLFLLALLAILAFLQYRWTGQLSASERATLASGLNSSVRRFAQDFQEETLSALRFFRMEPRDEGASFGDRWERFRSESAYPGLLDSVYISTPDGLTRMSEDGSHAPVNWPDALAPLKERLQGRERGRRRLAPAPIVWHDPPAIAFPIPGPPRGRRGARGHLLVTLDREVLALELLPDLVGRHFGDDYDVAVVAGEGHVLYSTLGEDETFRNPDARGSLFAPVRPGPRPPRDLGSRDGPPGRGAWEVRVRHRAGSLDEAVEAVRLRNLAVSFGILGLLAASVVLVVISTRRATELNDRKMEFVAGVSHELRTPVAVVRSAGQNLADGAVTEEAQVKRYGALIESEAKRLETLVEQVLELAGIQSHKKSVRNETVPVLDVVSRAVDDAEAVAAERGVRIERRGATDDVAVRGDGDALRRAVGNLINNAVKHGSPDGGTVVVDVASQDGVVRVAVSDDGPGIPAPERERIFEAFFRGSRAVEDHVPGSGLGLSLVDHVVRAHGGRASYETRAGGGSVFTLELPEADDGA